MPPLDEILDYKIVIGDSWSFRRWVEDLPEAISRAWFTIKAAPSNSAVGVSDGDLLLQKEITATDVPGTGQILDTGADNRGRVRFDIAPSDYDNLVAEVWYYWDVQVKGISGGIYTSESGTIRFKPQVTKAQ